MRDNEWLEQTLKDIWEQYFHDVEKVNDIEIKFGRKSKRRLGSISLIDNKISRITLTGHYKDKTIPDYVVMDTIMHELVHYTHGFSSKHKRKYSHPHKGGIIKKELVKRGVFEISRNSRAWLLDNWHSYVNS